MVDEDVRQQAWQDYTATMLWLVASSFSENELPKFMDLVQGNKKSDGPTADEIFDNVVEKLDRYSGRRLVSGINSVYASSTSKT